MCRFLRNVPVIKVEKSLLNFVFQNVVLLSAEEKKEQVIEIKEEVVEQIEVAEQIEISSLPKNEEDIEIIPVQEEEEEEEEEKKKRQRLNPNRRVGEPQTVSTWQ